MTKPTVLNKNADKTYSHKYAPQYKIYSVNHEEVSVKTQSFYKRKGWIMIHEDQDLLSTLKSNEYYYDSNLKGMVSQLNGIKTTQVNLMSGKTYEESVTTPISCSPSSETYWSM